jgi:DNA-binding CsgD family transcriptional regulator/PAS domain-containing protein
MTQVDLDQALRHPLVVWDSSGTIQLANQAAADLTGRTLGEIVGTMVKEFASPGDVIERAVASLVTGQFDGMHSRRTLNDGTDEVVEVCATSRAIEVDGRREGLTVFVPDRDLGRIGHEPICRPEHVPVAVGVTTPGWVITAISTEVRELLSRAPDRCVGERLLSFVHPDDVDLLSGVDRTPSVAVSYPRLRFATEERSWRTLSMLVAPARAREGPLIRFALVGLADEVLTESSNRVVELESCLRRIGAEVVAAGIVGSLQPEADLREFPQLDELSARQWEVLHRLLEGERVATIATRLFVSRSTVRNHLATIFGKFGVHSQGELIELLRRPKNGTSWEQEGAE